MNHERVYNRLKELDGYSSWSSWAQCPSQAMWVAMFRWGEIAVRERKTIPERYDRYRELDVSFSTPWNRLHEIQQRSWQHFFQAVEEEMTGTKELVSSALACTCSMKTLMMKGCPQKRGGVCEP